jgi:hypothetical protein
VGYRFVSWTSLRWREPRPEQLMRSAVVGKSARREVMDE